MLHAEASPASGYVFRDLSLENSQALWNDTVYDLRERKSRGREISPILPYSTLSSLYKRAKN